MLNINPFSIIILIITKTKIIIIFTSIISFKYSKKSSIFYTSTIKSIILKVNPIIFKYIIYFIIYTILLGVRLYLLKDMVKLPVMMYVREVLFKVLPVIVISFVILGMVVYLMNPSFIRLLILFEVSSALLLAILFWIT